MRLLHLLIAGFADELRNLGVRSYRLHENVGGIQRETAGDELQSGTRLDSPLNASNPFLGS